MVGLAAAMFIGLFAFGHELLGWGTGSDNEVQTGLFIAFILGIICGYKTKG
jgi:O-antigen/teichoic acid export membrane protein